MCIMKILTMISNVFDSIHQRVSLMELIYRAHPKTCFNLIIAADITTSMYDVSSTLLNFNPQS